MDLFDLFQQLSEPDNLVAAGAALAAFAAIITITGPLMKKDQFEARLKGVASHRERLRQKHRDSLGLNGQRKSLREDPRGMMRNIVDRFQLDKLLEDPTLANKMMQAGMRGRRPIVIFYFARLVTPVVGFVASLVYLFLIADMGFEPMMRFAIAVGIGVGGYYAPGLYLSNIAQKRRASIMSAFPDALDLLLICVEAGMSIEAAFQKVAGEVGSASMELAEELSLTTAELSYLQERRQAYENLARRTNHPGVKAVAVALVQAERYGTPLGNALRVMAKENRDMRLSAAEKKAASLPAKLTVPMIIFFLPVLFVVILGPAIIRFNASGGLPGG
ncbi:MAG: type II secretion system F family protein [Maricaulaceae bacterium]|jgi:tight adherence protein C